MTFMTLVFLLSITPLIVFVSFSNPSQFLVFESEGTYGLSTQLQFGILYVICSRAWAFSFVLLSLYYGSIKSNLFCWNGLNRNYFFYSFVRLVLVLISLIIKQHTRRCWLLMKYVNRWKAPTCMYLCFSTMAMYDHYLSVASPSLYRMDIDTLAVSHYNYRTALWVSY